DQLALRMPSASGATVAAPQLGRQAYAALTAAGESARSLGDEFVSVEHLLVGLARDGGDVATLLRDAGAAPKPLLDAFERVRGGQRVTSKEPEGTYQSLEKYGV